MMANCLYGNGLVIFCSIYLRCKKKKKKKIGRKKKLSLILLWTLNSRTELVLNYDKNGNYYHHSLLQGKTFMMKLIFEKKKLTLVDVY